MKNGWRIERLNDSHRRGEFRCGKAPLDEFLRALAGQYEKRGIGRTYVAVRANDPRVYGYYTLAAGAVPFVHLPAKIARKLPKHPVPVAHLGRLAVDQSAQGRGLGEELLADALRQCLELSETLGLYAVEVLAIDTAAKDFYMKYGFARLEDDELHLYMPMTAVRESFGKR
jgi:GNAT superfamily N-acetyltransferase